MHLWCFTCSFLGHQQHADIAIYQTLTRVIITIQLCFCHGIIDLIAVFLYLFFHTCPGLFVGGLFNASLINASVLLRILTALKTFLFWRKIAACPGARPMVLMASGYSYFIL